LIKASIKIKAVTISEPNLITQFIIIGTIIIETIADSNSWKCRLFFIDCVDVCDHWILEIFKDIVGDVQ